MPKFLSGFENACSKKFESQSVVVADSNLKVLVFKSWEPEAAPATVVVSGPIFWEY